MTELRKAISKRIRFEVFKRDEFACQYCGSTPPAVVLHIDHINAVANGGGNEIDNLVTCCVACNLGKGARSLASIPQSLKDKAEDIAEREAQLLGYQEILDQKRARVEAEVDRVSAIYEQFVPGYTLSDGGRITTRQFLAKIGLHECMDAMEIAGSRWHYNTDKIFRYYCGVCWNKIRTQADGSRS